LGDAHPNFGGLFQIDFTVPAGVDNPRFSVSDNKIAVVVNDLSFSLPLEFLNLARALDSICLTRSFVLILSELFIKQYQAYDNYPAMTRPKAATSINEHHHSFNAYIHH
jgi:hypothetical protein